MSDYDQLFIWSWRVGGKIPRCCALPLELARAPPELRALVRAGAVHALFRHWIPETGWVGWGYVDHGHRAWAWFPGGDKTADWRMGAEVFDH